MKIPRRSLSQYREAVDEQAEAAKRYVARALSIYFEQNPNASTADGRNFAIELLKAAMPNFCDAAGTLAADFFDEVCEAEGIDVSSQLYDATDYSIVEDKVRYFAGRLNDGNVDAFKREVVDATHYFVKRSAYDNMVMNCEANEVRYARVPSGFETCSFCFMLASRGFVYRSEERARGVHGYHDHCDCCIVPGKIGRTSIEGYDPQGMYERWLECEKSIGGDVQAKDEWKALTKEERDAYIQRHKVEEKAFRQFKANRVMREAETRDWHWLYTGEVPLRVHRYTADEVLPNMKGQFGKKVDTHAADWGLDRQNPEHRKLFFEITRDIITNATEVFPGEFLGQPDGVVFYLRGDDVVMTKPDGRYVTTMKGGVNNEHVKRARVENTKGRG